MKSTVQKIMAMCMSMLLLLSTVTWTVDKHLCMGRTMDVALFSKAESCGMDMAMNALEEGALKNHCCDNETTVIQGQDDLKLVNIDVDVFQSFVFLLTTTASSDVEIAAVSATSKTQYPPPDRIIKDRNILYQTFRI